MDMNKAVAKAIGAERNIAGLTVRKLAAVSGIPERSLMRILQAERDIKINQVQAIARALKLYPHEIIEHAEQILARASREAPTLIALNGPASVEDVDRHPPSSFDLATKQNKPSELGVPVSGEYPDD